MNTRGISKETEREVTVTLTPERFQALAVANALEIYARHGMKVNRAYTPANMLRTAGAITGKTYKRGQYIEAATDLRAFAAQLKENQQ